MLTSRLIPRTAVRSAFTRSTLPVVAPRWRRSYATEAEEKDLVIIGGGVAGYVAAIKAGQEGLKVRKPVISLSLYRYDCLVALLAAGRG